MARRRNHPRRLARFVGKQWRESMNGNDWCVVRGHRVVIVTVPPLGYLRPIVYCPDGRRLRGQLCRTADEAKAAAFGLIFNDDGSLKGEPDAD